MEEINAFNINVINRLRSGNIEEAEYLNFDSRLHLNSAKLDDLLYRSSASEEQLQLARLKIQTEETKALALISQDTANTTNVGSFDHGHAIDNSKNKWLESGLRLLSVFANLTKLTKTRIDHHNKQGSDWASLQVLLFMKGAVLVLLSPVLDLKKTKLLYFTIDASSRLLQNSRTDSDGSLSEELKKYDQLILILQNVGSLKVVYYNNFTDFQNWLLRQIFETSHSTSASPAFSFLNLLPQNLVKKNLFQSVFEYNMYAISSLYSTITLQHLIEHNLQTGKTNDNNDDNNNNNNNNTTEDKESITEVRILSLLSNMINSGRLHATIDQSRDLIIFDSSDAVSAMDDDSKEYNQQITQWQKWYMKKLLVSLNDVAEEIADKKL